MLSLGVLVTSVCVAGYISRGRQLEADHEHLRSASGTDPPRRALACDARVPLCRRLPEVVVPMCSGCSSFRDGVSTARQIRLPPQLSSKLRAAQRFATFAQALVHPYEA